jgi:chromosome segregation ATPase
MNMIKFTTLGLCLMLYATAGHAAARAKLYKWVDDKGETHYGEVVPPEYANRDQTQLNAVRDKKKSSSSTAQPVEKSPEQLAEIEQRRKDQALLNTYSNEHEIDLARGRNLQQVEARINSIEMQLKTVKDNLKGYNQEQANLKKAKKAIPESLLTDLADAKKRQVDLESEMTEAKEKEAAVRATYDADKSRYHELTVGPAK